MAFDGSYESGLAFLGAVDMARAVGGSVDLVAVAVPPAVVGHGVSVDRDLQEAIEAELRGQLDEAIAAVPDDVPAEGAVLRGEPVRRLVEAAADSDILMVGSRGYGPLRRTLLGSVAGALVRSARCPVLVYPRGTQSSTSSGGRRGVGVTGGP